MPVAPEFQDPPAAPNYYPYFVNFDPPPLSMRSVPAIDRLQFLVDVGDQNLADTLYVRWAADYPPYVQGQSKILVDGTEGMGSPIPPGSQQTEIRPTVGFSTRCEEFAPGLPSHTLAVIVSDRPFQPADLPFAGDLRYNVVGSSSMGVPVTFPLMTEWFITGCPSR